MKLAYLGYDKTSFKTHNVLECYFDQIDSYLVDANLEANDLFFSKLQLIANNVCIPVDETLRTTQHKLVLKEIKNDYAGLKKSISYNYDLPTVKQSKALDYKKKQMVLKDILSINFNKLTNKHEIQTKNFELLEYDYLIIQGHQLVADRIQDIKQNIINKIQVQTHLILNIEFTIKYKIDKQHLKQEFIFIENILLKTIFDNWYICGISQNKISLGLFIPYSQRSSVEFLDFITNRTQDLLNKSFTSFTIGEMLNRWESASDGFVSSKMALRYPRNSSVFPSFVFWTQNKINDYIQNLFVIKNKKNRFLFAEKGNS